MIRAATLCTSVALGVAGGGAAAPEPTPLPELRAPVGAHADEPGFASGDDLVAKLRETTRIVTAAPPPPTRDAR